MCLGSPHAAEWVPCSFAAAHDTKQKAKDPDPNSLLLKCKNLVSETSFGLFFYLRYLLLIEGAASQLILWIFLIMSGDNTKNN